MYLLQIWTLASTSLATITVSVKLLDLMMLDAFLWKVVHPTKNLSVHQTAQHTTMSVCFSRKCVFFDLTSPYNTRAAVKVSCIEEYLYPQIFGNRFPSSCLKWYYDVKMLFSFSLDSDFYLAKMHHTNYCGSISKTSLISKISRLNCPPLPDSVPVDLH